MRCRARLILLAIVTLMGARVTAATDGWAQLRVGMSRAQTSAVLGHALMTSSGRGFDIAIYDGRAEVILFAGRVVEWTAPASAAAAAPAPKGTWQFGRNANAGSAGQAARGDAGTPRPQTTRPATLPVFIR